MDFEKKWKEKEKKYQIIEEIKIKLKELVERDLISQEKADKLLRKEIEKMEEEGF